MTLPSTGPLKFSDIQTEFSGTPNFSDYYAGNLVPTGRTGVNGPIPSTGPLKFSHFRGSAKLLSWTAGASILQATITNPTGTADSFGCSYWSRSVALSYNGNTMVIGARGYSSNLGCAYVYTRQGSVWTQAQILSPSVTGTCYFGSSVSISNDGLTVVVGCEYERLGAKNGAGTVYVFTYNGTSWVQTQKLTAPTATEFQYFGYAVSISGDASRIFVITQLTSSYVFVNVGGTWQIEKTLAFVGNSCDLNTDGSRVALGFTGANSVSGGATGGAYLYTRSGSTWSLTRSVNSGDTYLQNYSSDLCGFSVAVASDGLNFVVGAPQDEPIGNVNYTDGSVSMHTNTSGTWTTSKKSYGNVSSQRGWSVDITDDGTIAFAGSRNYQTHRGAVYVYQRSGSTWNELTVLQTGSVLDNYFGTCVALSGDGSTAAIGAVMTSPVVNAGAVYVYCLT